MQNNSKGVKPKQQQQKQPSQVPNTQTNTKKFRNVALQSTRFASYEDPTVPVPRRTVNTQTGGNLGVPTSTSTSDLRVPGAPQRYVRGPGPRGIGRNLNPIPGGLVRVNNIKAQPPPAQLALPIEESQNVKESLGVGVDKSDFVPGQPRQSIQVQVQQQYAQPLPLFPIPVSVPPQTQNFVRVQPIQGQQMKPQQIPIPGPIQPQNQNVIGIPSMQQNQGIEDDKYYTPFLSDPGRAAAGEIVGPPRVNIRMSRILVTNSQRNPLQQELPDEVLQSINKMYEDLHLGHLPLTDDGVLQPFKTMFEDVPPKCPEGYEVLLDTENIFVEHADVENANTFFSVHNQYDVVNTFGDRMYSSGELLNNLSRPDCGGAQNFKLSIIGCHGGEVFTLKGENFIAKLRNRKKELIGSIKTMWQTCDSSAIYLIKDKHGHIIYQLSHEMGNRNIYDYEIFDKQMTKIGRMSKTWIGLPYPDQELPYSYGVSFPVETDVQEKALLMGALFVAFFQFFEDTQRERRYNRTFCCVMTMWVIFFALLMIGLALAYIIMK